MVSVMYKSEVKKYFLNWVILLYVHYITYNQRCLIQLLRKQFLRTCILTLQGIKSIQCTATIKYIIWSYQSAIYSVYFLWSVRLYLQLFVGGIVFYLPYLCLFTFSGVQHISYCVFVLSLSCVPYVASLSGLSIFDFHFGILQRLLKNRKPQIIKFTSCLPMVDGSLISPSTQQIIIIIILWYSNDGSWWNSQRISIKEKKTSVKENAYRSYKLFPTWKVLSFPRSTKAGISTSPIEFNTKI